MKVVAIDIGSTWTKGAAFSVAGDEVELLARATHPTTVANLADGFFEVLQTVVPDDAIGRIRRGELRLHYSSSAKGGLAVAALGLVPEVTLEIGKLAAQSAGAKLTQVFAYRLTRADLARLEEMPPDILLFAGGTDGGNTRYVLANAEAIAASALDCEIIYAGNRDVADEVAALLAGKRLTLAANLLPAFNEPDPEPAREAIRAVFLRAIVRGKGLDRIVEATGVEPLPTPYAMLDYVEAIRTQVPGWEAFMLLDVGGATTDVYSACDSTAEPGVVVRGLPEPPVRRTVEGDLGLRVSAAVTAQAEPATLDAALTRAGLSAEVFAEAAQRRAASPEILADSEAERWVDIALAGLCVAQACERHTGRHQPVHTPEGEVRVQTGRNLKTVGKVIGSGGWLGRQADFDPRPWLAGRVLDARGRQVLLPRRFDYYRDEDNLFPLLANLARACPRAAARAGVARLKQ